MKTIFKGIFSAFTLFLFTQCKTASNAPTDHEKTFIVNSQTVDCTGVVPMKCLQIKEKTSDNWNNFYSNIDGFTYEPGFEYILKVKTEKIDNPPAEMHLL